MEDIADAVNVHKDTVSEICRKTAELPDSDKPAAGHENDTTIVYALMRRRC